MRLLLRALLLILAALAGAGACEVPAALAPTRAPEWRRAAVASYALCAASPQCARRFHLVGGSADADWPAFAFLFDALLGDMRINVTRIDALLCGADGAGDAYAWQLVLENFYFCTDNEVPDASAPSGCVCRRDKVCHETPGDEYAFSRGSYTLVTLAFLFAVVYYGAKNSHDIALLARSAPAAPRAPGAVPARAHAPNTDVVLQL